ncbi:hypothetical protein JCM14036_25850 [Desulfotomaculum defluvii]
MKFITEMELRDLYKTEPFTTYVLEPATKITPGARQFLVDRRVTLVQAQCSESKKQNTDESDKTPARQHWGTLRLRKRMDYIDSLFLLIAAELLNAGDAVLSEEVLALGKCFRNLQHAERENTSPDNIQFWGWSEDEIKKRSDNLEIEISEFHIGLANGKEIALLNHLRASLREVEPILLEIFWDEEKQVCSRQELIDTLYLIINILCIMMWKCLGGQKWQR